MEKIRTIDLTHLTNASHFQYMTDFDGFATAASPEVAAVLAPYLPRFNTLLAQEDSLFKLIQKSDLTLPIKVADKERSGLHDGLWRIVRAQTNDSEDIILVDAATQALAYFDVYGSVNKKTYAEETALLTNLISDLETMSSGLSVLQINGLVSKLSQVNTRVATLLLERDEEKAESHLQEKLHNVRQQIDAVYQAMVGAINASVILDPEVYALFVAEINILIARYRKRRRKTSASGDDDNGEDGGDDGDPDDGGDEEIDIIEETKIVEKLKR